MKHLRQLGLAGWLGRSLLAVVVLLSVSGYLVTSRTVDGDRQSAAERSALVTSVRTQGVLGRLRAAVVALGGALADEPRPEQRRFAQVANSTAGSVGLVDTMWVQSVAGSERTSYCSSCYTGRYPVEFPRDQASYLQLALKLDKGELVIT